MAVWHIHNKAGENVETFDDGLTARPGEPGFSREAVDARLVSLKGHTANYSGTPNWVPPPEFTAEQVAALADLALWQMSDPVGFAEMQQHIAIRAEFDALFAVADDATKEKLQTILDARLAPPQPPEGE